MEDHGRETLPLGKLIADRVAGGMESGRLGPQAPTVDEITDNVRKAIAHISSGTSGVTITPNPPLPQRRASDEKPTNPKDAIGTDKVPYHLWPNTASIMGSLGLLEGMLKYGRSNWREAGIRFTIYYDAAQRHMDKLKAGEDIDEDSGLPHEAHILACWAIIVDAKAAGKFVDDRDYNGEGYLKLLKSATPHVRRMKDKYADRKPKHWTIEDNPKSE